MSKAEIRLVLAFSILLLLLFVLKPSSREPKALFDYKRVLITEHIKANSTEDIITLDSGSVIPALYTGINDLKKTYLFKKPNIVLLTSASCYSNC